MKNDFDLIKDKIENENITAPSSLDDKSALELLNSNKAPSNAIKLNKKSNGYKAVVSMVACFAVVVCSVFGLIAYKTTDKVNSDPTLNQNNASVEALNLETYSSYDDVSSKLKKLVKTQNFTYGYTMKGDILTESATDTIDEVSDSSTAISRTNIQVEGVDEADIVKTDGKYIYFTSTTNELIIYKVDNGKKEKMSSIKLADINEDGDYGYQELYLCGDKVVAVWSNYIFNFEDYTSTSTCTVKVIDVTDKKNPKIEYSFGQSGAIVSTRMVNNYLYLVSSYSVNNEHDFPKTNNEDIAYGCIVGFPEIEEPSFTVISAIDIQNHKSNEVKTKAILGGAGDIYCSNKNIYVTNYRLNMAYQLKGDLKRDNDVPKTNIVKIAYDKLDLNIVANGEIKGYVNNQYSMNEKDNYFYVAATTQTKSGNDINTLYVLDENLKQISKVDNFAKNESIKAVRYFGDYAYVITYEQTDPLFIIDLSNPQKPTIKGEVKIDGFSTSLFPIGNDYILGVGNYVSDNAIDGVKLVLFDISDLKNPKVSDEYFIKDCYSMAQDNIKAITLLENGVAIPLTEYGSDYQDTNGGALVVNYKDGKFVDSKRYKDTEYLLRVVRIGDYLYGVCEMNNKLVSYKMK